MQTAKDVMRKDVISIPGAHTLEQAIQVMVGGGISGAPVVDEDQNLVGIISELQLLEVIYSPALKHALVSKFMTREVLSVVEDTPVHDIATIFVLHRVRRVPVLRDGQVVGLIARRDLLRCALQPEDAVLELAAAGRAGG
jgi:CBS domain-containing protein